MTNLNYGQVVHGLGVLNKTTNPYKESKGVVLSLHDFEGSVEFVNNNVTHNMVFIPSGIVANNQKFNQSSFNP
jgi:hypothetical protein